MTIHLCHLTHLYFGGCGGCPLKNLCIERGIGLAERRDLVRQSLGRHAVIEDVQIDEAVVEDGRDEHAARGHLAHLEDAAAGLARRRPQRLHLGVEVAGAVREAEGDHVARVVEHGQRVGRHLGNKETFFSGALKLLFLGLKIFFILTLTTKSLPMGNIRRMHITY